VLLFVPYAGLKVAIWPMKQAAKYNQKYRIAGRVADLLTWRGEAGELHLAFGYESGVGTSIIALSAQSRDLFGRGDRFEIEGGYLDEEKNLAEFAYATPEERFQFQLIGRFANKENRPFYGLGSHSPDARHAVNRQRALGEASLLYRPRRPFFIALTGYARDQDIFDASDEPSARAAFPDLFARARNDQYVGVEGAIVYDGRDLEEFSSRGTLVRVYGGYNDSRKDDDESYRHYGAELQTFVNIFRHTRVLALRAFAEGVDAADPSGIPYTELPRLGGKTGQRGYNRYRFADRNVLLLTVEYRYRATEHFTAQIFTDWGSVAREWQYLRLADVTPSYGFGMSVGRSSHRLVAHVAHSREGTEFFVGTERVFKFRSRRLQ
jgi:hypothetical protein